MCSSGQCAGVQNTLSRELMERPSARYRIRWSKQMEKSVRAFSDTWHASSPTLLPDPRLLHKHGYSRHTWHKFTQLTSKWETDLACHDDQVSLDSLTDFPICLDQLVQKQKAKLANSLWVWALSEMLYLVLNSSMYSAVLCWPQGTVGVVPWFLWSLRKRLMKCLYEKFGFSSCDQTTIAQVCWKSVCRSRFLTFDYRCGFLKLVMTLLMH